MKLFNIFNEDWQTVRGYDRERYTELPGLEGPISTKSGKVLYYDKKEGKYYDRDTDMYLDHDDALAFLNEDFEAEFGFPLVEKDDIASTGKTQRILTLMRAKYPQAENDIEALLLHFDTGQARDRTDINRLGAENDAEEEEIDALQKELDKIKARRGIGEAESNKERAERAAIAKIQDQFKDMPKYKPQSAEERAKAHKEREERAMAKAKENADMLMKLADKHGESISASEVGYFAKGIADGKRGYSDPKAGDALGPNVYAYDAGVRVGEKLGASVNEDYYETDEQRELARLGRIIMDMGAKRDDDIGTAMGAVGNELTRYGTPQGVNSIQKLEKVTGQPESVIMKMMALAQKVQGDVAVGDETAGNDDEVEEGVFDKDGMLGKFVKTDTGTDVTTGEPNAPTFMGFNVATRDKKIEGLKNAIKIAQSNDGSGRDWKKGKVPTIKDVPRLRAELAKLEKEKAMQGESVEDIEEADFEKNFKKRVGYTVRGGAASDMMKQQAAQAQANNPDAGTGLGPSVLNIPKAREKAAKRGITAPGNLRASPNTRDPKRLPEGWAEIDTSSLTKEPGDKIFTLTLSKTGEEYKVPGKDIIDAFQKFKELYWNKNKSLIDINDVDEFAGNRLLASKFSEALDHDIKIGDTVETKKMGQMQGVVTGFSTKSGDTRVMFKHKSGKVYATPASNLKVIDTVKKTESQVAENIELRHDLQPGTYKHKLQNIQVSIDNNGSVTFMQPAQWEIEGDQEYLEYVESQLAMPEYWDAELDEAKKKPVPTDPSKWSYYKSQAKKKFDVYPSAYANAWAAKQYKAAGGGWRMGKPKK